MSTEHHDGSESKSCGSCEHGHDDTALPRNALVIASGALLGAGMLLQWLKLGPPLLHTSCYALATLAGGLLVFPAAFKALKKARLDMNVLMTVAVTGAWLVGEGAEVVQPQPRQVSTSRNRRGKLGGWIGHAPSSASGPECPYKNEGTPQHSAP